MEIAIEWLRQAPWWQAGLALLGENLFIFLFALGLGHFLIRRFGHRRVAEPPEPTDRTEMATAASTVILNTVVTILGMALWRARIIEFREDVGLRAWLDIPVLLLLMDLAMYLLHRTAHHPWLYPILHRLHHRYDRPRPMTLFVLNPVENLSFGLLWLAVISVYSFSWMGMSIYLFLNVVFGVIGHIGVEPLPAVWTRIPILRLIAGSSFHAQHHQDLDHNYGFYTLIWDRLFRTLRPDYSAAFGKIPDWAPAHHGTGDPIRSA